MESAWLLPDLDDPTTAPFWEGCARGELLVQACGVVRDVAHAAAADVPALPVDRRRVGTRRVGRGRIWSFIVPHPPLLPAFAEVAPYNAIIVELEEDPTIRFAGNLVASADGEINEIDPDDHRDRRTGAGRVPPDRRRVPPALGPPVSERGPSYPLEPGGVGDYPIKVGSMLLTLVDPTPGFEVAYNRWYERDHFYAGCMIGPWLFAGSRWVATRDLKDRRWPSDDETVACPPDAGSYVAIYYVERGHHEDHFSDWARPK